MARNQTARKGFNEETGEIYFEFTNGERLTVNPDSLSPEMQRRAMIHGLLQKGGDSYAGAETVDEAVENCRATLDAVAGGEWAAAREGVGAGGGDLIRALCMVKGADEAKARAVVLAMDDDQRRAVRGIPAVKAALATIAAERAAAKAAKAQADAGDTGGLDALGL